MPPETVTGFTEDEGKAIIDMMSKRPPSLDELEDEYGEPNERDFWPWIKVQVSPETHELFLSFMGQIDGEDEAFKVGRIMDAVDATLLSTELS